jgi:hypothetical protein
MSYKAQGSKLKAGPSAVGGKRAQSLRLKISATDIAKLRRSEVEKVRGRRFAV